ncbi:helix-turn-helix domain-containing protein [Kitasatospora purpeofusca]|uniref:helix-turn-helix domain-containing protein n=1 Tax=Kitasatospora purpeofusca TaxID=67352 RepID=UPI00224D8603|nr:helix-turn-helix transcriptional regulator [Kitasatospora purpeofusca]MCX4688174.1 helix-turn-helix domain-containing protein [Kitasatospora purpeofusca]
MFRWVQHHSGASQARIATQVGMTQSRVNEIINGRREVVRLDVFERIADGLNMPNDARRLLGLAPQRESRAPGAAFDLAAFPEIVRVYSDQASAAAEIQRTARSATELDVLAVRGLGLLALRDSLLRPHLDRDGDEPPRLRVLLLAPDSPALIRRAAEIGESPESLSGGVRLAEARLRELAEIGRVEVYRYRTLPVWRVIRLDKTLYVSAFDTDREGHESATYKVLATPYGPLYRGWRRMFDAMVDDAVRVI